MSLVKYFGENTKGRDFCVGDIHGSYVRLAAFMDKLKFDPTKDRLFSTGDLCDRGPDSPDVIDWLCQPWFHPVLGNHDRMLIDAYDAPYPNEEALYINGGIWWAALTPEEKAEYYWEFMALPMMIEVMVGGRKFGIIHANALYNDWEETKKVVKDRHSHEGNFVIWDRTRHYGERVGYVKGVDQLLVGHNVVPEAQWEKNVINLDTGGVFFGKIKGFDAGLTILDMTNMEFYKECDYATK